MELRDLGERVRLQRERRGLTQNELGGPLGVSPQAVSKWERGENAPDIALLSPLADALAVSVDWLLGRGPQEDGLSYEKAGVSIPAAMRAKARIAELLPARDPRVLSSFSAFAQVLGPQFAGLDDPVLVLKAEEPGSKQLLALQRGWLRGIGHDLVNHLTNDVMAVGATPLAVVDAILCGHLEPDTIVELVAGIAEACTDQEALLLGGETSEQPGVLPDGSYMLCATMLGVVERQRILDGSRVAPGDTLLCLPSNGPHTNGYSLIRKLLELDPLLARKPIGEESFLEAVLRPHRCYRQCLKELTASPDLHGLAHITGGGIPDNLARILPEGPAARIDLTAIRVPPLFTAIRDAGRVSDAEMLRTFNCGVGMIAVSAPEAAAAFRKHLAGQGCEAYVIGGIVPGEGQVTFGGALSW
jgi:phosphoribosylformylglycinamidine cyclo-ligase